jgi:hypothetical protein
MFALKVAAAESIPGAEKFIRRAPSIAFYSLDLRPFNCSRLPIQLKAAGKGCGNIMTFFTAPRVIFCDTFFIIDVALIGIALKISPCSFTAEIAVINLDFWQPGCIDLCLKCRRVEFTDVGLIWVFVFCHPKGKNLGNCVYFGF